MDDGGHAGPPGLLAGGGVCEMVAAVISMGGRSRGVPGSERARSGVKLLGESDGDHGGELRSRELRQGAVVVVRTPASHTARSAARKK